MKLTASDFAIIVNRLGQQGADDIAWAEGLLPPTDPDDFALEAIFVICNSGMKNTVARGIYQRVVKQIYAGGPVREVFRHPGKAKAIETIWFDRRGLFTRYMAATDKLEFCGSMPWIGGITKYHLAKNFGADVAKPDVHLQRLADFEGVTAQQLCERLAAETGYRVATIDTILWRACANGVINSRSGHLVGRSALGHGDSNMKLTEAEWRNVDDLRKHWTAFCDADPFAGSNTFTLRMEAAGYIELVPVDDAALQHSFAAERGIERGGMMWALTDIGRALLEGKDVSDV